MLLTTCSLMTLSKKALKLYYENVAQMPDENPHVLTAVDITDAIAIEFVIAIDKYACPLCKGPLVYRRLKECPSLADYMREGTAPPTPRAK